MKAFAHASVPSINGISNVGVETRHQFNRLARRTVEICTRLRRQGPSEFLRTLSSRFAAQRGTVAMIRWASLKTRRIGDDPSASRGFGPEGFDETVLCHLDAAYNLARFLTRDGTTAEDLVQEAVLKAYRGFPLFRGGDAKAWLLTIVRREVIDWANARRRSHQVFTDVEDEFIEELLVDADDPEQALIKKDQHAAVRRAIQSLPATYRESIILRDIEDLSYRDIAAITGVSIGTVMSRISRGRDLLTQKLLKDSMRPRSGQ